MRPLPLRLVPGSPAFVLGVAAIRGEPTPVVDCGALLARAEPAQHTRWIAVRCGSRSAALAVEEAIGIRDLQRPGELPPLLSSAVSVAGIAALDPELALVLRSSRLVPDVVWTALQGSAENP